MLTFFEFYDALLGFVLYKLYGELGVRYPLPTVASSGCESNVSIANLHPNLGGKATSVLAANLSALQIALNEAARGNSAADAVKDAMQNNRDGDNNCNDDSDEVNRKAVRAQKKKQRELMQSIDEALKAVDEDCDENHNANEDADNDDDFVDEEEYQVPIAAPLREALEAIDDYVMSNNENENIVITSPEAQKRHQLFGNMTFFLSREVPRGYLELIILSYGGKVGWEGQDSPILINDSAITHHVVDRPKLLSSYFTLPKSREYIQPQWILDCANFNFILPVQRYGVGHELPPHLSPWVDDNEEGYVPKYKEEIEKIRNGEIIDENDEDNMDSGAVKAYRTTNDDLSEGGASASKKDTESNVDESEEDEEEDDVEAERKAIKKKETEVNIYFEFDDTSLFNLHFLTRHFPLLLIFFAGRGGS
jgi:pescadillo protein